MARIKTAIEADGDRHAGFFNLAQAVIHALDVQIDRLFTEDRFSGPGAAVSSSACVFVGEAIRTESTSGSASAVAASATCAPYLSAVCRAAPASGSTT